MSSRSSSPAKVVPATEFKAQCLALIDRVAAGHGPIVISKRGRPVVRLVALAEPHKRPPLVGSVTLVDLEDDLLSTHVAWEASARRRS